MGVEEVGVSSGGAFVRKSYPVTPMGKPRQTRRDRWQQRPEVMRYRAYADTLRLMRCRLPQGGASVTFVLPMPGSWSRRRRERMAGTPHQQRPDLDNLVKALCDAVMPEDDSGVWDLHATKVWGEAGAVLIEEGLADA